MKRVFPAVTLFCLSCLLPGAIFGKDCVVLLHGLARTSKSLDKMDQALQQAGFATVNVDYPSRELPIERLAERAVSYGVAVCRGRNAERIHFVTHSLGGILVRVYLADTELPELGRVVMLSPPNRGSEAADMLRDQGWYRWFNGPAGQQLGTGPDSVPSSLGPVRFPLGIITGDTSAFFDRWLSELIPGADDGKVSVERARVAGMHDFLVVHESHPFIMDADEVIRQTIHFLRNGRFDRGR